MSDLAAVVHVDRHGQQILLLLVADERRLEPEDRLGEVQGPRALDLQGESCRQRDRAAQSVFHALRRQVQAGQIQLEMPAAVDGVGQEAIDQRRPVGGQLRAGMLGDRLGIEDQADHLRLAGGLSTRQHQVVDLGLDLVPHPTGDLRVIAEELF